MSILSRIFGKSPPATERPADPAPAARVETPRPDHAARAREEEASLAQAIAGGDASAVARWVVDGSTTGVRQQAAQAITDPEQLRELIRATRHGNDKTVHRILTDKRDALLAEARLAEQQQADVAAAAVAIERLAGKPCDGAYAATLAQLEARWTTVAPHATESVQASVAQDFARAREALERHRQAIEKAAAEQQAAAAAAEEALRQRVAAAQAAAAVAAEHAQLIEAERRAEREQQAADEAAVRDLVGLLRQAQAALDRGGTARAARLRESIAEKLPQAPALPEWFARKLLQVDERLDELKDWKTFRVGPKRAELLERIRSLIGADIAPEELARQVRRLRDEWRTLHRGAGQDDSPEWQQFEEAAERAYEPCREHFAQQAGQRKENQAKREALLERLAAFAAGQADDQADFRVIRQVLAEARQEWQQYAPVDQSVVKDLQARFHALLDGLHSRLEAEYSRNVQARRDLIARAAGLVTLDDVRQSIDECKRLQQAWKDTGIVPRQHEQSLWEEFRRHCDAVFARSAQVAAAHGAALDANQARAEAICAEFERAAGLAGDELRAAVGQLDALAEEFDALELPRSSARELRQRFRRAGENCRRAVDRERAAEQRRGWSDLFTAAAVVRAYALATVQDGPADDRESLRTAALAALDGLAHAPKAARAALEQQLAKIAAGDIASDLTANEAALRLLCVRAELIADVETPDEDQPLRSEYQMQRLVASMGRGERPTPADLDSLAIEWLAAGPVEAAVHDRLYARFERCRAAGKG